MTSGARGRRGAQAGERVCACSIYNIYIIYKKTRDCTTNAGKSQAFFMKKIYKN